MRTIVMFVVVLAVLCGGCGGTGGSDAAVASAAPRPEPTAEEKAAARNKKIGSFVLNSLLGSAVASAEAAESHEQFKRDFVGRK